MVSDCTLQVTFKELQLDEFWCSIKDFPNLSVRLLKYFSNICMRPDVFRGLQWKQYTAIGYNWVGDPSVLHERDLPKCPKCHSSHYFFLFWKTVYYKIQFAMTACNGLLLLFQHESIQLLLLLLSRFSRVQLCATPEMAPPSLGFSKQEHWGGLPFPSPMYESKK